jgi:hypothetical protein
MLGDGAGIYAEPDREVGREGTEGGGPRKSSRGGLPSAVFLPLFFFLFLLLDFLRDLEAEPESPSSSAPSGRTLESLN